MSKTILILAANPKDTPRLRLDEEVREIDNSLRKSSQKDEFVLKQRWATRSEDASWSILDTKPYIVHFCGHGQGDSGIALEDEAGHTKLISVSALSGLFELFAEHIGCVVLNACYSEIQAEAIAQHINYVIGLKKGIEDSVAIKFSAAFYEAIGAGKTIEFAYRFACNAIRLYWDDIPDNLMPILVMKKRPMEDVKRQLDRKVDCVILCGGYSKRLWPLTRDISKVLLPVAGKPVVEYMLDAVQDSSAIQTTIMSVNQKFAHQIQEFIKGYRAKASRHSIEVIVEPTTSEKEKLGPVGALDYIVSQSGPRDLLVLGGDNILGFRIDDFLRFGAYFTEQRSYNAISPYQPHIQNQIADLGFANTDAGGVILGVDEKTMQPRPENMTHSTGKNLKISTACYFLVKRDVELIHDYIKTGGNPDRLGGYIDWLANQGLLWSIPFPQVWFDIGTRESLLQANSYYISHFMKGISRRRNHLKSVLVANGAEVSTSSKLGPDVYICSNAQIVDSCISNSIIMERSIIRNSVIHDSLIGPDSEIEDYCLPKGESVVCGPQTRWKVEDLNKAA